jgi:hypothetical protein
MLSSNGVNYIQSGFNTDSVLTHPLSFGPAYLGTSYLYITAGGNVGIGTTTPGYLLDVAGTGRFSSNLMLYNDLVSPRIQIFGQGANTFVGIDLYPYYGSLGGKLNFRDVAYGSTMEFSNGYGGPSPTLYERFRIDVNGNVGINQSAPVGQLHVRTTGNATVTGAGWGTDWVLITPVANSGTPANTPEIGRAHV